MLVAVYLYAYAIPQYNRPVWSAAVDTSGAMPVPSFTLAANSASASIKIQSCGKYTAPGDNFEHGCDEGVISMIAPRDPHYSGELIFFNASQLPSKTIAPFSEYYTISFSITCKFSSFVTQKMLTITLQTTCKVINRRRW